MIAAEIISSENVLWSKISSSFAVSSFAGTVSSDVEVDVVEVSSAETEMLTCNRRLAERINEKKITNILFTTFFVFISNSKYFL